MDSQTAGDKAKEAEVETQSGIDVQRKRVRYGKRKERGQKETTEGEKAVPRRSFA